MALNMTFNFGEMAKFQKTLRQMGNLPQKVVNKAANAGATVAGDAVKAAAPIGKTGRLSKGFKKTAEKSKVKGRKVYHYAMSDKKNKFFQKPIPANPEHPGKRKSKYPWAYYPASIEYGFLTRSGGNGISYVPGTHFARNAAEKARPRVERAAVRTLVSEMEKVWQKKR